MHKTKREHVLEFEISALEIELRHREESLRIEEERLVSYRAELHACMRDLEDAREKLRAYRNEGVS